MVEVAEEEAVATAWAFMDIIGVISMAANRLVMPVLPRIDGLVVGGNLMVVCFFCCCLLLACSCLPVFSRPIHSIEN